MSFMNHCSDSVEFIITVTSNECQAIPIHLPLECLLSSLFRLTSKRISHLCTTDPSKCMEFIGQARVNGHLYGNSPMGFPFPSLHNKPVTWKTSWHHDIIMHTHTRTDIRTRTRIYRVFECIFKTWKNETSRS